MNKIVPGFFQFSFYILSLKEFIHTHSISNLPCTISQLSKFHSIIYPTEVLYPSKIVNIFCSHSSSFSNINIYAYMDIQTYSFLSSLSPTQSHVSLVAEHIITHYLLQAKYYENKYMRVFPSDPKQV